jgi:drug/metabolite transporter (DMT)-like permease
MGATSLRPPPRAVAGLLFNAMTWGLSWWPMRQLHEAGLHPLWATAIIFAIAFSAISVRAPGAWKELASSPPLWIILLAAGTNNASFNWGVTAGDVVRVILLFYVMPLWAVLLARLVLHERITPQAVLRVALGLAGAAIVLWPSGDAGWGDIHLVDGLGLLGGFSFAVNNIMLKRESHRPGGGRGLAMFLGGCLVSCALALGLQVGAPPAPGWWMAGAVAMGLVFLASNLSLQYGVSRLPANVTAVIMLTEVLWASGSALALGAGTMTPQLAIGGGLILGAAALAAIKP